MSRTEEPYRAETYAPAPNRCRESSYALAVISGAATLSSLCVCISVLIRSRESPDWRSGSDVRHARRAANLIEQTEATLEEASGVIANGYLRPAARLNRAIMARAGNCHSTDTQTEPSR